jgi:hypothetical protein
MILFYFLSFNFCACGLKNKIMSMLFKILDICIYKYNETLIIILYGLSHGLEHK